MLFPDIQVLGLLQQHALVARTIEYEQREEFIDSIQVAAGRVTIRLQGFCILEYKLVNLDVDKQFL